MHRSVGVPEQIILTVGVWRLESLVVGLSQPVRFALYVILLLLICLAYALLKSEIVGRLVKDRSPRLSLGQQVAALRRDAVSLLAGVTPAYAFFTWSESSLLADGKDDVVALVVGVVTMALFIGGYCAGYLFDKAVGSSKRG